MGTFLLWFGWYGFNLHGYGRDMAHFAVTTTISAATSGITGLMRPRSGWPPRWAASLLYTMLLDVLLLRLAPTPPISSHSI